MRPDRFRYLTNWTVRLSRKIRLNHAEFLRNFGQRRMGRQIILGCPPILLDDHFFANDDRNFVFPIEIQTGGIPMTESRLKFGCTPC